jgi:trehalose 6-phosphate phosphatase
LIIAPTRAQEEAPPSPLPELDGSFALFLDFDGTLVDIAAKPDAIIVPPRVPALLAALRDRLEGALAIVSGRPIAVLDAYLAPHRFDAAGLHGAEQRSDGVVEVESSADPLRLRPLAAELKALAGRHPGLILEDKTRSLALHWRLAPELEGIAVAAMQSAAQGLGAEYRLQEGKNVLELLPRWATKGAAITRFMDRPAYARRTPVFVGDDATDEHGFEVVEGMGGIAIRIGEGPTRAAHRLQNPAALHHVLARWCAPAAGAVPPKANQERP